MLDDVSPSSSSMVYNSFILHIPAVIQLDEEHYMKLGQWLPDGLVYTGLTLNTQQLQPGEIFVAIKGEQQDGRSYIADAIKKGAQAVLCEAEGLQHFSLPTTTIPIIPIPQLSTQLVLLAKAFYQGATVPIIGVTGTNGKTTTTYLLAQALSQLGKATAILGTIGYGFVGNLQESPLTTPDIFTLHRMLATLKEQGACTVAMEVSSHGLTQHRVDSLPIESAIFTNLTQDHLDYHETMEAYAQAKARLFQLPSVVQAIVNADCPFGKIIAKDIPAQTALTWYSVKEQVRDIIFDKSGFSAQLNTPWGRGVFRSVLWGPFNVSNMLAVLTQLCVRDIPLATALEVLSSVQPPPGRMERIQSTTAPHIIIDYAHTPDALEKALQAARVHSKGRIWCVFGCGGDRDRTKRPAMGAVSAQYADVSIVTNDNPRSEDPQAIIADIIAGMHNHPVTVEQDRAKAIALAITQAQRGDTILIAGKGHENYQIIKDRKLPFSDVQTVNAILQGGDAV